MDRLGPPPVRSRDTDRTTRTLNLKRTAARGFPYLFRIHPLGRDEAPRGLLVREPLTAGRAADAGNAIVLDDPHASRVHARFEAVGSAGGRVTDLDSKNGIRVNGLPIRERDLADGDRVRIGDTLFAWRVMRVDMPEPVPIGPGFVGFAPGFRIALARAARLAPTRAPVLLQGETGSGKEVLARFLHDRSDRGGRFVPVNCAAVTPTLFESALFGHRRGAFTGAVADFEGAIGAARGGTLFLDEIGELPVEVQAKLLRFLEAGEVATVGESVPGHADVRILAATNRDLEAALEDGRFRPDLYARLAGHVVRIPPLRERPEDVLLLARDRLGASGHALTADAAEALAVHDWPFNVRELLGVLEGLAIALAPGTPVSLEDLPPALQQRILDAQEPAPDEPGPPDRDTLAALLAACDGNVSEAARRLGKDRRQLYRWMDRLGLR